MDTLLSLAESFGPWAALCAVLLWYIFWLSKNAIQHSQEREHQLVQRVQTLEKLYRDDLRTMLRSASSALAENTRALHAAADGLRQIANALHHCPCVQPDTLNPLQDAAARAASHRHD